MATRTMLLDCKFVITCGYVGDWGSLPASDGGILTLLDAR
jgi:hypothetical protein